MSTMISGITSTVYSCTQTCTSGLTSVAGKSTLTKCCSTNNCNTVSSNTLPIIQGNVTECYTGIIAGTTESIRSVSCIPPMNAFCQVTIIFNCSMVKRLINKFFLSKRLKR